jgi:hypothetical protein
MTENNRITFRIPLGDWSGDGHSKCEYFTATSAKSLIEVREAYFSAKEKLPKLICPENFVNEYEDSTVPQEVIDKLKEYNYNLCKDSEYFELEEMVKYVVWFINYGDPECDVKLEKIDDMLVFYGVDKKKRHIGGFGYGLLGD